MNDKKERLYERLDDYNRATKRLNEAVKIDIDNDIVYDGVIQRFEFTFELSWETVKLFLDYMGISDLRSPRATIREAFQYGLIEDDDQWISMMIDRNKFFHLYDEEEARIIYHKIKEEYNSRLSQLAITLEKQMQKI